MLFRRCASIVAAKQSADVVGLRNQVIGLSAGDLFVALRLGGVDEGVQPQMHCKTGALHDALTVLRRLDDAAVMSETLTIRLPAADEREYPACFPATRPAPPMIYLLDTGPLVSALAGQEPQFGS